MIKKKKKPHALTLVQEEALLWSDEANSSLSIQSMSSRIIEFTNEKEQICEVAARTILKALDAKDNYTYSHCERVCHFSMILGEELKLPIQSMHDLQLASLFHDIGKITTPDAVLNKPTRLSDVEFRIMKQHPLRSYDILKSLPSFQSIAKYAKHHHERFDGRGYPDRLKGEKIPQISRIILIADTFDAMISNRAYRKGFPREFAYGELIEFSGTQFDPELVKHFISAMRKEEAKKESELYVPLMDEVFQKKSA